MSKPPSLRLDHRQVMPDEGAPSAFDLAACLAKHTPVWTGEEGPPGFWGQGAPLGNGDLGAMLYGPPECLSFILGKADIWIRSTSRSYFPPGKTYADLLRIYRAGDREAFEKLLPSDPHWLDDYQPSTLTAAGIWRLHMAEPAGVRAFHQELSLLDATCRTRFEAPGLDRMWSDKNDFLVESFASAAHEVLTVRVQRHRLPLRSFSWRLGRERHHLLAEPRAGVTGGAAWVTQDLLHGDAYAVALLQVGVEPRLTVAGRSVLAECATDSASEAVFFVAVATRRDADDPLALALQRVKAAAALGFDPIHAQHRQAWAGEWRRSWVACDDAEVERPWYVSNYLVGSSIRPGKVSPGLQGAWCKENIPAWQADFHGNINIQVLYQGIMGANRIDLFEPCASLYHGMLKQCRADTLEYFGVHGARLPHAGGIDGHEQTEWAWFPLAYSIAPSAWIARLFWWAYQHTLDRRFLAEVAYPILRDVAVFYRELLDLVGKGADGRYLLDLSIYGEAHCTSFDAWGTNSSYDNVAYRMGLEQSAQAAEALGVDRELAAGWRQAIADLPPIPVDEEGVWIWWEKHRNPKGNGRVGAASFFHPVFPGEIAGAFHGPPHHRLQAKTSWERFARDSTASPWCSGVPVVAAALLGDAQWCHRVARGLCRNGLSASMRSGVLQADHGTGMSLGLNAMLLLAPEGTLVLFPGMPADRDASFHSLRAPGAILVSAAQRGGRVTHVALQPLAGGTVRMLNPFDPKTMGGGDRVEVVVRPADGAAIHRAPLGFREPLEWVAQPGVVYRVEPAPSRT